MLSELPAFQVPRGPLAHFGPGALARLPEAVRAAGAGAVLIVTDATLAATPVIPQVAGTLEAAGIPLRVFTGVHPNPTTDDIAAGADAVPFLSGEHQTVTVTTSSSAPPFTSTRTFTAPSASARTRGFTSATSSVTSASSVEVTVSHSGAPARVALVAVGGGSPIDAAKGIALAAVNPQRGRDLDYRNDFAVPALPLIAIPTTAGTGAETNAFGVVTDPAAHRKFYVGHASALPAAVILDPALTLGLPPAVTAATGMDALTHATESYLSARPNPYSAGVALQVIRMVARYLPAAVADGRDLEARSQLLLAAHMAGLAMAGTGLGIVHAIGHSLGGRWNIAHGVALTMILPDCLRFSRPARTGQLADVAFALGAGDTSAPADRNATAAIEAVTALRGQVGLTSRLADHGITEADYGQIAADALADEVLANTPRQPTAADITEILAASAR
jgi:alcohol dehydrogenase